MLSRDQIVHAAVDAGYGAPDKLRRKFIGWQRIGLMGSSLNASPGQRAGRLWHPGQRDLFLRLLRQERAGRASRVGGRPTTLANMPVSAWILGWPGVEWVQATKAFEYWAARRASSRMPADARSLRRRGIEEIVRRYSAPDTPVLARRHLRRTLELILDGIPDEIGVEELPDALLAVMSPHEPPAPAQRARARRYSEAVRCSLTGLRYLRELLRTSPETLAFWEWGRRSLVATEQLMRARDPATWSQLSGVEMRQVGDFSNRACAALLRTFGRGIRQSMTRPKVVAADPAPPLPGVRRASTS